VNFVNRRPAGPDLEVFFISTRKLLDQIIRIAVPMLAKYTVEYNNKSATNDRKNTWTN